MKIYPALSPTTPLTITSWNVNSIKARIHHVCQYLNEAAPDILLLQELKCQKETFPSILLEELGYQCAIHGQKTYNGVAIISKYPLEDIITSLPGDSEDHEARYIEAVISLENKILRVASVYVPNGQAPESPKFTYKLKYFDRLYHHFSRLYSYEELLVIGGDFNVAPTPMDVYHPATLEGTVCFHPEERKRWRKLTHPGLIDAYRTLYPHQQAFSWWDYRANGFAHGKGMRIDHLLLSPEAADHLVDCQILDTYRALPQPSDHAPVSCTLKV